MSLGGLRISKCPLLHIGKRLAPCAGLDSAHLTKTVATMAATAQNTSEVPVRTYTTGPCGLASPPTMWWMSCARLPKYVRTELSKPMPADSAQGPTSHPWIHAIQT